MNRVASALLSAVLLAAAHGMARAADWADREIIGFSPDGATFAFEEFGVQDGSGFPYANVYVIDTATDSWVKGTPVRVLVEDETVNLDEARAKALEDAEAVLTGRGVIPHGYDLVASNPPSEMSADPHGVRFLAHRQPHFMSRIWDLRLTPLPMPEGEACANLDGAVHGFRLVLTDPDGNARTIHEDKAVPASRFCPRDYAITDVIVFRPGDGEEAVMIVLLHLIRQGFEGEDRRYLAVATTFEGY